jgi:hypothetical protein
MASTGPIKIALPDDSAILLDGRLLPAEGLAQNPERCRNGNEEQA